MVAFFREFRRLAQLLSDPDIETLAEQPYLTTGVVDVELAPDLGSGCPPQGGQGVADRRRPGAHHVQRAGRVGRHELEQDSPVGQPIAAAISLGLGQRFGQRLFKPTWPEAEVQKPGAGDLDRLQRHGGIVRRDLQECLAESLGHLARRASDPTGQGESGGGGQVAVGGVARGLQGDLGGGQIPPLSGCGLGQGSTEFRCGPGDQGHVNQPSSPSPTSSRGASPQSRSRA